VNKTIFSGRPIVTKQYFDGTGAWNWTSTASEVQRFGVETYDPIGLVPDDFGCFTCITNCFIQMNT